MLSLLEIVQFILQHNISGISAHTTAHVTEGAIIAFHNAILNAFFNAFDNIFARICHMGFACSLLLLKLLVRLHEVMIGFILVGWIFHASESGGGRGCSKGLLNSGYVLYCFELGSII